MDVSDSRFDVDKDVVDGRLVREDRGDAEEVEEKAAEEEKDAEAAMEGDDNKAT